MGKHSDWEKKDKHHKVKVGRYVPFNDGYVFTSDARGDFESTTIHRFNRKSSQQLEKIFS